MSPMHYFLFFLCLLLPLSTASTYSPWLLRSNATLHVAETDLDIIDSTVNSTHIHVLDSRCRISLFTYGTYGINSLGFVAGLDSAGLTSNLCGGSWTPWRESGTGAIKWNNVTNKLLVAKYVLNYGTPNHRAVIYEYSGAVKLSFQNFDIPTQNIPFFAAGLEYPQITLHIGDSIYFGLFNNFNLDPQGDTGFFIAKMDHFNTSSYSWISNSTQQTLSIQFQCNNAPIVCILTTSRTVEEYRMSDLGFQRSYSLDPTAIDVSFAPISALPGNETSALFFHARSSQMNLQKRNNSGFTTQISSIPYTLSLPYGIPRADMAVSTTGGVFTSVTTALNASFGLGQTEILLSYFRPSVDLKSTLIFTTVAQDNMSRIFVSGENSVVLTGLTEGVFISPNTVDSRQIFAVEFSYVEISVSTIIPNHVIATEVVQILFNQNLPSFVLSSLPKVTLGVMNCTDIQWNGSSLLARVPQGTGGPYEFAVRFDYLDYPFSVNAPNFTYHGEPALLNVSPLNGAGSGFNITIQANNVGPMNFVPIVTVGGRECSAVVHQSANTLICTTPPGSGRNHSVVVSFGLIFNTTESFLVSYDPPVLLQIKPNTGTTEGQNSVALEGYNFGPCLLPNATCDSSANNIWVTVGTKNCSSIKQMGDARITCSVPEGAGANIPVMMGVNGQNNSNNIQYSYEVPLISRVVPASVASTNPIVYLEGRNFGPATSIRSVIFRDTNDTTQYVCPSVVWSSHRNIRCEFTNVSLPLLAIFNLTIIVDGQSNDPSTYTQFKTGIPNIAPVAFPFNDTLDEDTFLITQLQVYDENTDDTIQVFITSDPTYGTLYQVTRFGTRGALIDSNASYSLVVDSIFRVLYVPPPNFHGNDTFYFKAVDKLNAESTIQSANLTILPVPDPPRPLSDELTTDEDTPLLLSLTAEFPDTPGHPNNSILLMSQPNKGRLYFTVNGSVNPQNWTLIEELPAVMPVNSSILFMPDSNEHGNPYTKFNFAASDGNLNSTVNGTISIIVKPVNDQPYFNKSSVSNIKASEDQDQYILLDIGDFDMDGRLSVKISDIRINGTLYHIDRQTGLKSSLAIGEGSELIGPPFQVVFVPKQNFFSSDLSLYQRFNVVVTDLAPGGITFAERVVFPVVSVNDAPTFSCDPSNIVLPPDFLTDKNGVLGIALKAADVDDSNLTYYALNLPSKGGLYSRNGERITVGKPFTSLDLIYRAENAGGSSPFPNFTVFAVDSHGSNSEQCTFVFTVSCPPGLYNNIFKNNSGSFCESCPGGAVCSHDGSAPPRPQFGYWRSDQNSTYLPCFPAEACPGTDENKCSIGYDNTRCGQCSSGYYRLGERCFGCSGRSIVGMVLIAFCLFVVGPIVLGISHRFGNGPSFGVVSIAINFAQTILILRQLQLDWPPEFHAVINALSIINFNIDVASPECYLFNESLNFSLKLKLSLVVPFILIAISSFIVIIEPIVAIFFFRRSQKTIDSEEISRPVRFARIVNILLLFVYMNVATNSLALFDCTLENDGRSYLDADRSLICYEEWWRQDLLVAVPAVCIYVLGIPLYFSLMSYASTQTTTSNAFWARLRRVSSKIMTQDNLFERKYQFFTVIQLSQKLIMVMINMFLTRYPGLQIILNQAVLLLSFQLILKYNPYKYVTLNRLDLLAHISSIAVLALGLPFYVDKSEGGTYKSALMAMILTVIVGFLLTAVVGMIYEIQKGLQGMKARFTRTTSMKKH